ncbi:MAG TPA: GGDEF domain-containing protein [Candidatus Sulfotelmatobacter sp.]|nr:GGDEF domain-containing protein [Candidatus Sulfotelmatobacter sp.]
MKSVATLFAPGGLILLAALVILRPGVLPDSMSAYVRAYPYVVLGTGLFLGWYFNRSRVVFALLVLALAGAALRYLPPDQSVGARAAFDALCLLVPLNLTGYAFLTERGLLTRRGRARLLAIAVQALVAGLILRAGPGLAAGLEHPFVAARYTAWTDVPQVSLFAFGGCMVALAVRSLLRRSPMQAGFLWAVASAFVALHGMRFGWSATNAFTTGGLILIGALMTTAYRMAYRDDLTGLPGRRALGEALLQLGSRYAVAMVDVDHFKRFNDTYGHDVGDQVLRMVAAKLGTVAGRGRAFRYGGEEFAILFPDTAAKEALPHLEAVRKAIEGSPFVLRAPGRPRKKPASSRPRTSAGKEVSVTVSIGVAERNDRRPDPEQVIKAADKALYRAKQAGRNRVMV